MERQAPVVHITATDVERGIVDVRDGSRLVITTAAPSGYTLHFTSLRKPFQAVQIDGVGGTFELGSTGGRFVARDSVAGRQVVNVNYRFILAPNTIPGTYDWPLTMVVRRSVAGVFAPAHAARPLFTVGAKW